MKKSKIQWHKPFFLAMALIGAAGMGCSHPQVQPTPYDSVTVDRPNPEHTIIVLNGSCSMDEGGKRKTASTDKKDDSVTENGKTYYFSSIAERDRFLQKYMANSRY
jgi:hypothetical protein